MKFLIFKKEFRLAFLLLLIFGLFVFTINQTAQQIVYYFTDTTFYYYKNAYLKMIYLVLLVVTLALFLALNRNENVVEKDKGNAFTSFVLWAVVSFFPGWIIHLYFLIQTVKDDGSFMELEQNFWIYHCHDFTLMIGFCLAAIFILRPVIHKE